MGNLIGKYENKQGATVLRMNPIGKWFSDTNYLVGMAVCPNPKCDCGNISMLLVKEDNLGTANSEYRLPLDVYDEKFQYTQKAYVKEGNAIHIPQLIADGLTAEDWKSLRNEHHRRKFEHIEYLDIDEIDHEFEDVQHDDITLMFWYADVFPLSKFLVELNGKEYEVFDNYCKNPACLCTKVSLNILATKERDDEEMPIGVGTYHYDYKARKVVVGKESQTIVSSIIKELPRRYGNMDKLFENRHQNVKKLYTKSRKAYDEASQVRTSMKISRNQLCPCGSGKKYKRCCMKKDEALR